MAAVTICSDFGAPKNKVWHCFHYFPIYFPWSDETDPMFFVFWMLSFKPTFSLSSFTFIKRLFSSSSLSAIRKKLVEVMEFLLSYFKFWEMMLWKCCTQYVSKFGALSNGQRTGKGQFSFKSQRKAMPKNAQTTAQLHSSHTLVK